MNKTLAALALISVLALLIVGCGRQEAQQPAGENTAEKTAGQAADSTIPEDIKEVDSLSNELDDPELNSTGDYLDEVSW